MKPDLGAYVGPSPPGLAEGFCSGHRHPPQSEDRPFSDVEDFGGAQEPREGYEIPFELDLSHEAAHPGDLARSLSAPDGAPIAPPVPAAEGSEAELGRRLEKRARYLCVCRLAPPGGARTLDAGLEVSLLRRNGEGGWVAAEPEPGHGVPVYSLGERLALRIVHHHEDPLHLSVLDLGVASGVALLYPLPGGAEPLGPGKVLEIGVRPGDELEVQVPEGWVELARGGIVGTEILRVFATSRETDLEFLAGPSMQAGDGRRSGLAAALGRAWGVRAVRSGGEEAANDEGWTVATVRFLVRTPEG